MKEGAQLRKIVDSDDFIVISSKTRSRDKVLCALNDEQHDKTWETSSLFSAFRNEEAHSSSSTMRNFREI